jgi:ActR/RegA family two-component response regulator
MAVAPSCNAFVVHDDDAFRKRLVITLDEQHFSVTTAADGDDALKALQQRVYDVVLVGLDIKSRKGVAILNHLRDHREQMKCGIIIIGEADPALRTFAPWVDETLMKPVDADYIAKRARTYCGC